MEPKVNHQWLLERRPRGLVTREDFRWAEQPIPSPADGEVLVRNLYLSCDPTQRGWMAADTYLPAVALGEVMRSFAAGEVVESRAPRFQRGELVQGLFGWQEYAIARPNTPSAPARLPPGASIETAMSALGLTGITAYFGLLEIGRPVAGETVVVSGAAGATGSIVGQIAKLKGCRVVGIAGGPEKCQYVVRDLGFDAAVDYRAEDVSERLRATCPDGVHVYFDNVGGAALEAALERLALRGRVVLCGAIARYNDAAPPRGPRNYLNLLVRRGRMEGFIVLDYMSRAREAVAALSGWLQEGKIKDRVDVQHGLESAPDALARLFKGENQGKQLVKIAERITAAGEPAPR
jgi:NADPH-dependent curcumin reductase CurA